MPVVIRFRPGVCVVRRDADHLQIGLDPPHRVLVTDSPEVQAVLDAIGRGRPLPELTATTQECVDRLIDAGLLAHAHTRQDADRRRAAAEVQVFGPWRAAAGRLLAEAGVRVRPATAGAAMPRDAGSAEAPDVVLLTSVGEIDREVVDDYQRTGQPHLAVAGVDGKLRVGPFVVPGQTACLRCLDASWTVQDPRRAVIVSQYATSETWCEPPDGLLLTLALAWAVRDVVTHLEGGHPATWSRTVEIDDRLEPVTTSWLRHPHCGCAWGDLLASG